jgi:flagellar motility protein MotE (MotC chaperone)
MQRLRAALLAGLALKAMVIAAWWAGAARAENSRPVAEGAVPDDLLTRSRGFRDLLEGVRQRGEALAEREQAIGAREAAMKALEKTLADETARLEALSKALAGEGAAAVAVAGSPPGGPVLTRIYELMKPEEAGPILDRLDDATLKTILGRMKERPLGAILAAMSRDRAVAVTQALAAGQRAAARE